MVPPPPPKNSAKTKRPIAGVKVGPTARDELVEWSADYDTRDSILFRLKLVDRSNPARQKDFPIEIRMTRSEMLHLIELLASRLSRDGMPPFEVYRHETKHGTLVIEPHASEPSKYILRLNEDTIKDDFDSPKAAAKAAAAFDTKIPRWDELMGEVHVSAKLSEWQNMRVF